MFQVIKDKSIILESSSIKEVSEMLGVKESTIFTVINKPLTVKGCYIIKKYPTPLARSWEDMRMAAEFLKNGKGHIAVDTITGKKYVAVKEV